MAATYQWKPVRGHNEPGATVKATNGSTALGITFSPVQITSNVLAVPTEGCALYGVAIPSAGASAEDVPVIVADAVYEVQTTGNLNVDDKVMLAADGGVLALAGTDCLECGVIVDYNPASAGIAHCRAKCTPNDGQSAGS